MEGRGKMRADTGGQPPPWRQLSMPQCNLHMLLTTILHSGLFLILRLDAACPSVTPFVTGVASVQCSEMRCSREEGCGGVANY